MEFGAGVERYRAARKDGRTEPLEAVVLQVNRFVAPNLYVTGQAHSAFAGGAGAYSVGLFGVGAQLPVTQRLRLGVEALAGAAGGGGVDTQGGAVLQGRAYADLALTDSLSLRVAGGKIKSRARRAGRAGGRRGARVPLRRRPLEALSRWARRLPQRSRCATVRARGVAMPRSIWKGAIAFGLVHVPVALYPASQEDDIDFDWLDKRSMDPVGYQRINKRTGKPITKENIVKGVKQEDGTYVLMDDDEIRNAYPKTMQTIEIEAFVKASEIPFVYLEKPYYLEPIAKADKVYALLREAMIADDVIGIARVVMHTKEHLAALMPDGPMLVLNTLRWATEVRKWDELRIPPAGKAAANLKDAELKMAEPAGRRAHRQVEGRRVPRQLRRGDQEADQGQGRGRQHARGHADRVAGRQRGAVNVVDLTALLKNSLGKRRGRGPWRQGRGATRARAQGGGQDATKAAAGKKTCACGGSDPVVH